MRLLFLILLIVLLLIVSGCANISHSKSPFELTVISVSNGIDKYSGKQITKIEYEIKYNSDITVTSCLFVFVSDDGEEFKVSHLDLRYEMSYQDCEGTHMGGVKQKFVSHLDPRVNNKSGTYYVNLWSNEAADMIHYKKYSASAKYTKSID